MAVMFRTPDILNRITRKTHYNETDEYQDEAIEVQTIEVKLVKELDKMIAEGIPLSQTQLMKRTGVSGRTLQYYEYIFKDTIEMLSLFYPVEENSRIKESPKYKEAKKILDKNDIHDFGTLENMMLKKISALIMGADDDFAIMVDDLYNSGMISKNFHKKVLEPAQAISSFLGDRYIHPDFVALDINEMGKLVVDKYKKVQELKAEYERLKTEQ